MHAVDGKHIMLHL